VTLGIVDHGLGNRRNVEKALARVGVDAVVTADHEALRRANGLVVPGVGAFAACMAGIRAVGGDDVVRDRVAAGRPVLGICVGMQVLFGYGDEHGERTDGVGLFAGGVTRLSAPVLPHMGWNTVAVPPGSVLFRGVEGERFYFVHSYAARRAPGVVTTAEHGEPFVAAVEDGVVAATQFHPEKSGDAGAVLLANWVRTL
jgi:glutamine amidotransferase